MSRVIISDTSCLIALDRIGKMEILQKVFTSITTTPEVQAEFGKTMPPWIAIRQPRNTSKISELRNLVDEGEASAIALALEIPDSLLIIDERKGRRIARELKLDVIGTLRILLLAKKKGFIPDVQSITKSLEENNFRFNKNILIKVLREANEL
jgi:uncharacterized protein